MFSVGSPFEYSSMFVFSCGAQHPFYNNIHSNSWTLRPLRVVVAGYLLVTFMIYDAWIEVISLKATTHSSSEWGKVELLNDSNKGDDGSYWQIEYVERLGSGLFKFWLNISLSVVVRFLGNHFLWELFWLMAYYLEPRGWEVCTHWSL